MLKNLYILQNRCSPLSPVNLHSSRIIPFSNYYTHPHSIAAYLIPQFRFSPTALPRVAPITAIVDVLVQSHAAMSTL